MVRRLILGLAVLLMASGCASYTPSSAPVPAPVPDVELTSVEKYGASVDPYVDPILQEDVFDADFHEAGILAIQVVTKNNSDTPALVRRTDMMLSLPTGRRISPLSAHSAAVQVGEEGSVIGMTLAFGIIGGLAASNAEDTARDARIADYETKEFKDVTLGPRESAHGFVFFMPPPGTGAFNEASLDVRFVDAETAQSQIVTLPLQGLAFAGAGGGETIPTHKIRRSSAKCAESGNAEKPWIGNWSAKSGKAVLRLATSETAVNGDLKVGGKNIQIRGGITDRGRISASMVGGPDRWERVELNGNFPVLKVTRAGNRFATIRGAVFRLCS